MTDMRRGRLPQGARADHSIWTLSVCVAHCPPPPVARKLSNPSWKVIVSASHGQYLKPGSDEPGFFSHSVPCSDARTDIRSALISESRGAARSRSSWTWSEALKTLHRVRDTRTPLVNTRYPPADGKLMGLEGHSRG